VESGLKQMILSTNLIKFNKVVLPLHLHQQHLFIILIQIINVL